MDLTVFKHMDRDQFMAYIRFLLWNYRVIDDRTRVGATSHRPIPIPMTCSANGCFSRI